jgi:hypothetical protein
MLKMKKIIFLILLFISISIFGQEPKAISFVYKKITTTQRDAIDVSDAGKIPTIYNLTTERFEFYDGSEWRETNLEIGTTSTTAKAGDIPTITSTQASNITANNGKVSFTSTDSDRLAASLLNTTDTLTGDLTVTGDVKIGINKFLKGRNAADTTDVLLIGLDSNDKVKIDANGFGTVISSDLEVGKDLTVNGELSVTQAGTFASSVSATDGNFSGNLGIGIDSSSDYILDVEGGNVRVSPSSGGVDAYTFYEESAGPTGAVVGYDGALNNAFLGTTDDNNATIDKHLVISRTSGAATFASSVSVGGNLNLTESTSRFLGGGTASGRALFGNHDNSSYMMITGSSYSSNPDLMYFVNDGAVSLTLNKDNSATFASSVSATEMELNSDTSNLSKLKIGRSNSLTNALELGTDGGNSTITSIGVTGTNGALIFNRATPTTTTESFRVEGNGQATFASSVSANDTFIVNGVDSNPAANTDQLRVSGYGIIGNRGSVYITNSLAGGDIKFGIGGAHGTGTQLEIDANGATFASSVSASNIILEPTGSVGWKYESTGNQTTYNRIENDANGIRYKSGSWTSNGAIIAHSFKVGTAQNDAFIILNSGSATFASSVSADDFIGNNQTVNISTGGSGSIVFKPNGISSSIGEAYINASGSLFVSGSMNASSYNTTSDYRLKEDFKEFSGIEMISNIPVYDYKWKESGSRTYGVIAHELQEVLPQAVTSEKDGEEMQAVDYSKIVPLLIKSIQEQQEMLKELKAEIELLKNK